MEDSLRRTSELGREVLERARSREVDWWSQCTHNDRRSLKTRPAAEIPEEEHPESLEDAFNTLSRFMRETTEQCQKYHSRILGQEMNKCEIQHISRYHCRKLQPIPLKPPPCLTSSAGRRRDPRDVDIEVAPGTYSISASSHNGQTETQVVNITPGQSVDLVFNV
ncbi:A kinase (PRKA) interacting protein 1 [Pristimantis euphronides]